MAESAFSEAIVAAKTAGLAFAAAPLFCNLAEVQTIQGQLHQAIHTCEQAVELGTVNGTPIPAVGFAGLALGRILYEQNDLQNSERHILEGLALVQQGRILLGQETLYATLALTRQGLGDSEGATEAIEQAIEIAQGNNIPRLVNLVSAYQARIWLAQRHQRLTSRWAHAYRKSGEAEYLRVFEDLTLVHVLLAEGKPQEAQTLLKTTLLPAKAAKRTGHVIEILVLQSLTLLALNDKKGALDRLGRALELGEPGGYIRVFVDGGDQLAALLREASARPIAPEYVGRIQSALDVSQTVHSQAQPLPEPLTDRELEVLHLLEERLTNPEIADRLFVSLPTVKSHTRSIYGKLGVHSRRQAVAQAKKLGIL
jgi:LuxR family maltose regulon positive regulatory protein